MIPFENQSLNIHLFIYSIKYLYISVKAFVNYENLKADCDKKSVKIDSALLKS